MGKRLDQLNLDSTPVGGDDLARSRREAATFVEEVEGLLEDGDHDYAWGFLADVKISVEKAGRVTQAQKDAVENVKAGAERHQAQLDRWEQSERRTGRRYEGFGGRWK